MKFSELSYFTPSSSGEEVELTDPLFKFKKKLSVDAALNFLIEAYILPAEVSIENEEAKKIEHWWNRNWADSLDFYLSSIGEEEKKFSLCTQKEVRKLDRPFRTVLLPNPKEECLVGLSTALIERKTHRKYHPTTLAMNSFSLLINSTNEIKKTLFTHSLEYYIVIFDVEKISNGVYRYDKQRHALEGIKEGDFRESFRSIIYGMVAPLSAAFSIILVADYIFLQNNLFYNRALRDLYIEAGRVAQHLLIQGQRNKLGGLTSPAMKDTDMVSLLELDINKEIPVYTILMGSISPNTDNKL